MRKTIVAVSLAICAGFLGGCAGGGINGGSLLPSASLRPNDSTGGGIIVKKASRMHQLDSTGGGIIVKKASRMHQLDSTGGGIIVKGQKG